MSEVTVTNTSKEDFEDMFDGELFKFPSKVAVTLPLIAAHHIFGYNELDKEPWVVRLGWSITRNDMKAGLERLSKFKFEPPEKSQTRHSLSPVVERVPLSDPKGSGGKLAIAPLAT